jgi:uncharacterized protein YjiS (DUF1127 family)
MRAEFRRFHMTAIRCEAAHEHFAAIQPRRAPQQASVVAARVYAIFGEWRRRSRDRASLARLNDRMLADIGLTRADAEYLVNKPFWKE